MGNKFDVITAIKGEEKTIFFMPQGNNKIAAKAVLKNNLICSSMTNLSYIKYEYLDMTNIIYAIWILSVAFCSSLAKNYMFLLGAMCIAIYDIITKRTIAKYFSNVYLWKKDPFLQKQKDWIGAAIMTIKAYQRYGRIPTEKEVSKESRFYYCENEGTLIHLATAIAITIVAIVENFYCIDSFSVVSILGVCIMFLIYYILNYILGQFLSGYKIGVPNTDQIAVAIEALKKYDAMFETNCQNCDNDWKINAGNNSDKCYDIVFVVEIEKIRWRKNK